MEFKEEKSAGFRIHAYDKGEITLAAPPPIPLRGHPGAPGETGLQRITRSLILSSQTVITDWEPQVLADLRITHMQPLFELDPELVLLGTGASLQFPAREFLDQLYRVNVGVEVMDTAAACRTFNILVSEGRHVVAALLMI